MKFDESTISEHKRAEWARIERDYIASAPAVGAPVTFRGEPMIWFNKDEIHVDLSIWANCYDFPLEAEPKEIVAHINKLLGDVKIVFEGKLL